jgi:hypothetical protein
MDANRSELMDDPYHLKFGPPEVQEKTDLERVALR